MDNKWDTELPPKMTKKLNLLLQQRSQLVSNEQGLVGGPIIKRHQKAVLDKSQEFQKSVEKLLDKEKSCLLNIMDEDLARRASPNLRIARNSSTSQMSSISFSDYNSQNHKSNKTFRSLSTAFTQQTGQQSPSNYNSVPAFTEKDQKNQNPNDLLLQLSLKVNEQQIEIQQLKKQIQYCECVDLNQIKQTIEEKLQRQKQLYEQLLEEKGKDMKSSYGILFEQENILLKSQLSELKQATCYKETQMQKFKDSLVNKLQTYAQKLDLYNEKEQIYLKLERDNIRLKNDKEELQILLRNFIKPK